MRFLPCLGGSHCTNADVLVFLEAKTLPGAEGTPAGKRHMRIIPAESWRRKNKQPQIKAMLIILLLWYWDVWEAAFSVCVWIRPVILDFPSFRRERWRETDWNAKQYYNANLLTWWLQKPLEEAVPLRWGVLKLENTDMLCVWVTQPERTIFMRFSR